MMPFISIRSTSHVRNTLLAKTPHNSFSASGQEEVVLKAFKLGANDFMSKPFSPNELMNRVQLTLNNNGF
jgi:DNA-binding response OmpR family regulator